MDLRATLGYEAFKKDGMGLFIKAMTDPETVQKVSTDMQTLLESAWNQKGQAGGVMMLCRLVGYIEGLAGVVAGMLATETPEYFAGACVVTKRCREHAE